MSNVLGTLRVYIEGNNKDLLKKLRASENAMKNSRAVLNKVGSSMQTVGSALTKGLTLPITAATTALGVITKKAVDFEKQMKEVFTLLPGITKEGMDSMTSDLLAFSKKMGIMPEQAVKPLYDALSAGVPQDNVIDFLRVSAKNSIGGVAELSASVDLLTSVVNAYGFEAEQAGKVSDILFTTVRIGKTTISELSASISDVTPIASALGVSFEDIGGALATMTAQGINTAESTTYLKNMLNELGKDSTGVSVLFKELTGSTFPEFIAQGNSLGDALSIIDDHAKSNNTSINNLFTSIRSGQAALALSGKNAQSFADNLNEMEDASGATEQAFSKMEESVSRKLDKIKTALYTSLIKTGNKMLPLLEELVPVIQSQLLPAFEKFATEIQKLIVRFSELEPGMQKAILVMTAITAGVGPALSGMGRLVSGIGNVSKAMGVLKTLATALFSPTGLLIAGVAVATAGLVVLYKKAQEKKISAEFEAVAQSLNEANLNSDDFDKSIQSIADKTGLTVSQVLDIADGHGLITDELREQKEVLHSMSDQSEYTAKEIAKQNSDLKDFLGTAVNSGGDMAEIAKNFSKNMDVSLDRTVSLALQLENLSTLQKQQLNDLQQEIELNKQAKETLEEDVNLSQQLKNHYKEQKETSEEIVEAKQEEVATQQELLEIERRRKEISDSYKAGYAEILSIIDGEKTAIEQIEDKMEYISSFNWGSSSVYTEKQQQALAILQAQIDEINQAEIDAIEEKKLVIQEANNQHKNDYQDLVDSELEILHRQRDEEIRLAEQNGEETYWIKEKYILMEEQLLEEQAMAQRQRNIQTAQSWVNVMSSAMTSLNSIFSQLDMNRSQELDNWYQNEKERLEQTITDEEDLNSALEDLDEEHDKKKRKLQYEEAKRQKAMGIFTAGINMANAILNALTVQPFFPLGLAMATLAGIMGGAKIAAISQQPLPELADGGLIRQSVGGSPVIVGEGGNDEAVLPLSAEVYQEIGRGITDNMGSIEKTSQSVGSGMQCHMTFNLDSKPFAKSTVNLINNGLYTINPKSVRA